MLVALGSSALSYFSGLSEKKAINYLLVSQLAQSMEKTAAISAYLADRELGQEIVKGLLSNDLVKGVTLVGEGEMVIAQGKINDQADRISIKLMHPFIADNQVGTLNLYPDDQYIQQQAQQATEREVLLLLLHSVVIAFFVSLMVHKRLTRPIQNLTDSFATIDPSTPQTMRMITVKDGARDEIGKLVSGINSLMHELHLTISNERLLREKTQELESKFRLIFEQASAGICLLDENDMITTYNPAFARYFTASDENEMATLHFPLLLNNEDRLKELLTEIRDENNVDQITLDMECTVGHTTKWMHCLFAKLEDQRTNQRDKPGCLIEVIVHDITERTEREVKTRFEADHDPLTHLLNRRAGEKKLHKALFDSIKQQHYLVLMMIDLDKFKPVNDTFGHEAGDQVLIEVAQRIKNRFCLNTDICIRWGGDEFVVARQIESFNQDLSTQQAEGMLQDILLPIHISEYEKCEVGASIGIVVGPKDGKVLHELMVNADNTMYQVKEKGRCNVAFYQNKKPSKVS